MSVKLRVEVMAPLQYEFADFKIQSYAERKAKWYLNI